MTNTKKITISSILIVLGVLLPFATSHGFGLPGVVLLPMHIPVLLAGAFCGPFYGLACGVLTPILSSLTTGMPPVFPMLPIMIVELSIYGLVIGLMHKKLKLHIIPSLLVAMIAGRVGYGTVFYVLFQITEGPLKALSVWSAVTTGAIGIAVQIILIPIIVLALGKVLDNSSSLNSTYSLAINEIKSSKANIIVIKDGAIHIREFGRGISPLINIYDNHPQVLNGAIVVDKIIGKAAAMVLCLGNVKEVYGLVMSREAKKYLENSGVKAESGELVEHIINRDNTGMCPMEATVLDIEDNEEALAALRAKVEFLKSLHDKK